MLRPRGSLVSPMTPKKSPKKAPKSPAPKSAPKAREKAPSKSRVAPEKHGGKPSSRPTTKIAEKTRVDEGGDERSTQGAPTSPSELSPEVLEFLRAIDRYKRENRRPFPSWSEIFEIVKSLGYRKSA